MSEQHPPLTDDELEADTWASWWEAHSVIGEQVKAGRPLPALFEQRVRENAG